MDKYDYNSIAEQRVRSKKLVARNSQSHTLLASLATLENWNCSLEFAAFEATSAGCRSVPYGPQHYIRWVFGNVVLDQLPFSTKSVEHHDNPTQNTPEQDTWRINEHFVQLCSEIGVSILPPKLLVYPSNMPAATVTASTTRPPLAKLWRVRLGWQQWPARYQFQIMPLRKSNWVLKAVSILEKSSAIEIPNRLTKEHITLRKHPSSRTRHLTTTQISLNQHLMKTLNECDFFAAPCTTQHRITILNTTHNRSGEAQNKAKPSQTFGRSMAAHKSIATQSCRRYHHRLAPHMIWA